MLTSVELAAVCAFASAFRGCTDLHPLTAAPSTNELQRAFNMIDIFANVLL
jgi:hypothetical protein